MLCSKSFQNRKTTVRSNSLSSSLNHRSARIPISNCLSSLHFFPNKSKYSLLLLWNLIRWKYKMILPSHLIRNIHLNFRSLQKSMFYISILNQFHKMSHKSSNSPSIQTPVLPCLREQHKSAHDEKTVETNVFFGKTCRDFGRLSLSTYLPISPSFHLPSN